MGQVGQAPDYENPGSGISDTDTQSLCRAHWRAGLELLGAVSSLPWVCGGWELCAHIGSLALCPLGSSFPQMSAEGEDSVPSPKGPLTQGHLLLSETLL